MSFERRLSKRCAVLKPVLGVANAWNTRDTTYVAPTAPTSYESVPCFFYPDRGMENTAADRVAALQRGIFDFMPDVDVTTEDRIVFDGATYMVTESVLVGNAHHRKVRAQKIMVSK